MNRNAISFTILFKNTDTVITKLKDDAVHTFTCSAVDADDAVRQFRMSRMYSLPNIADKRCTKNPRMRKAFRVRKFRIVRVFHGDGLHYCTCEYCKTHKDMSPRVTVLPTKQPRWMMRNFFGKGR